VNWTPVVKDKPDATFSEVMWEEDVNIKLAMYATSTWVDFALYDKQDTSVEQPAITGYVKWDGCSEWYFDHIHLCGPFWYRRLFSLMEWVYKTAYNAGGFTEEPWNEEDCTCPIRSQ